MDNSSFIFVLVLIIFAAVVAGQSDVQTCPLTNGGIGVCTPVGRCQQALQDIKKGIYPEICWWYGRMPVICCPASSNLKLPGIKSEQICSKYHTLNNRFNIEQRNFVKPAVVGGENSLAREFPHMAALGFGEKDSIQWQCGGSLISELFVLTAAHCLHSKELGDVKWIRLGDLDIKNDFDDADPQDFEVADRIKHPDYKPPSEYNDIALIKLNQSVTLTAYVKPACLPTNLDFAFLTPIATGWGRTSFAGDTSEILQKVNLAFFDTQICREAYESLPSRKLARGIDEDSQVCAGSFTEGKDTCQGDSGGPLQIRNSRYFRAYDIIGITSFGKACGIANTPGVYTRVSHYVSWIEEVAFKE